jgi:hypothetical protein
MGALMFELRSRAAVTGVATGAALLALPVVAWGQVPVVDQVVGGVNQAADQVVQAAPVPLPAPPAVSVPKPAAPAPAVPAPPAAAPQAPSVAAPAPAGSGPSGSGPSGSAPSGSAPSNSAPAAAPARTGTVAEGSGSSGSAHRTRAAGGGSAAKGGHSKGEHAKSNRAGVHAQAAGKAAKIPANAAAAPTDTDIADKADSVPPDAKPAKLPFTGLELALLAMIGMTSLATGLSARRTLT